MGEMLPTTRELAETYGVSPWVVTQELQKLVDEGILYTIPRVGTFVGRQQPIPTGYYLMLLQQTGLGNDIRRQAQIGFEERVATLGGASLVMSLDKALEHLRCGELPALSGVFDFAYAPEDEIVWQSPAGVPVVRFIPSGTRENPNGYPNQATDVVSFDDNDGGRQATQHLLQLRHHNIAFLGLHPLKSAQNRYLWSAQRQSGWQAEMENAGYSTRGLSFHPPLEPASQAHNVNRESEIQLACETARALVRNRDITAVVAANDFAALGLFAALREAQVPSDRWPSVVGFDDLPQAQSYVLTSLRLPWEEVGKAAINLLWERKQGQIEAPTQERRIKLRLISRLTSRQNWSQEVNHAALAAALP